LIAEDVALLSREFRVVLDQRVNVMRVGLGLVAAGVLLFGQAAVHAADLPLKAPAYKAPIAAPVFSWTGFYVGGHVGGGWADTDASSVPSGLGLAGVDTTLWQLRGSGALAGAHAGFNWQFTPTWLLGIEGDGTWSGIKDNLATAATTGGVPIVGSAETMSRDIRWLATLRGRVGVTFDHWLLFGTGGAAWGGVNLAANTSFGGGVNTFPFSSSSTRSGWVAGGGVEYALSNDWLLRAEYLFYRLNGVTAAAPSTVGGFPGSYTYSWSDTNIHTARVGVEYKFGR
jgi:outer membrane immunogenic protein